ncbi:MAG: hypothetical protein JWL59_5190 [Chthoniobacteraceae bacterium]|nr:hypothetical protein [Chthoniobacteraceae bacterium]
MNEPNCMEMYMVCREGFERRAVPEQVGRVIEELMRISFAKDHVEARVPRLALLGDAAKVHKGNLRKVINEAVRGKMLLERSELVKTREGTKIETVFSILPDWRHWQFPDRFTTGEIARAECARAELEPEGMPVQKVLFEREKDLNDGLAAASRESAVYGESVAEMLGLEKVVSGTTSRTGDDFLSDSEAVVPETTGVNQSRFPQVNTDLESSDSDSPLKFKVSKAKAFNVKRADVQQEEEKAASPDSEPRREDPDFTTLVERMNRILGLEQVRSYGGVWRERATLSERAMRMAVDGYEERNERLKPVQCPWQLLLDRYLRAAVYLQHLERLREGDRLLWRKKQAKFQSLEAVK